MGFRDEFNQGKKITHRSIQVVKAARNCPDPREAARITKMAEGQIAGLFRSPHQGIGITVARFLGSITADFTNLSEP